jgi:hypothetical protein
MNQRIKQYLVLGLVIFSLILMLLSLRYGFLNIFSYSGSKPSTQGIDFFSLPKSFLNLLEMRSMYDSWGGAPYGPYSTWYISHPAFGLLIGFWFSFFAPWTSYWLFVLFSIAALACSAHTLSTCTANPLHKSACYPLLLCSFPVYWILHTGNIHSILVLGFTLILASLHALAYRQNESGNRPAKVYLLSGLLISFFSKPIALLYLPILLINKATRKTTTIGLLLYALISVAFLQTPLLNPEKVNTGEMAQIALDSQYVKEHLNVYKNNFVLNKYMKDNSIHWLHMIAQSDFYWNHIDIFSLAAFTNTLTGRVLPGLIYKIPLIIAIALSFLLALIQDPRKRLELSLLLTMALTLTFFLSYNTVWEYQFALFQPAVAMLFLLRKEADFFRRQWASLTLGLSFFFYLPTFYFLFRGREIDNFMLNAIRADKILPALIIYLILVGICGFEMAKEIRKKS